MDGGGDHADGGGGFSGGSDEQSTQYIGINGLGGGKENSSNSTGGGGYYTSGYGWSYRAYKIGRIGGQGGKWSDDRTIKAGDGGEAGAGGIVKYSDATKIHSYNGDMITNGNYTETYKRYDIAGNVTNEVLAIITKKNEDKCIPTYIFAQSGTIRETYTTNLYQEELDKIKTGITLPDIATSNSNLVCILATENKSTNTTGYANGYLQNQGIGSGAGYLESDNGTFEIIK